MDSTVSFFLFRYVDLFYHSCRYCIYIKYSTSCHVAYKTTPASDFYERDMSLFNNIYLYISKFAHWSVLYLKKNIITNNYSHSVTRNVASEIRGESHGVAAKMAARGSVRDFRVALRGRS